MIEKASSSPRSTTARNSAPELRAPGWTYSQSSCLSVRDRPFAALPLRSRPPGVRLYRSSNSCADVPFLTAGPDPVPPPRITPSRMKRTKSRRTRSPLSLWAITATATVAVLASASASPPPTFLQQPAPSEVAAVTRPVVSTSPAFPSGILGFEAVGQELGHLGRHPESFGEDRRRWRVGSVAEQLHRRQRRQGLIASTSPTPSSGGGTTASATASGTLQQAPSSSIAVATAASGTSTAPTSTSTAVPEGYTLPQPFE